MGCEQDRPLERVERAEIDAVGIERLQGFDVVGGQQSGAHQRRDIDQIRISGKGRETLVGRITVTRRTERTDLPVLEARGRKELQKGDGVFIQ